MCNSLVCLVIFQLCLLQTKQLEEDNKIKQELASLGLACRGERHALVMERQREALSELRRRIKELETLRSAIGGKGKQKARSESKDTM